jgi:hypothetical protein
MSESEQPKSEKVGWRLKAVNPSSGNPAKVLPVWFKTSKTLKGSYKRLEKWDRSHFSLIPNVSVKLQEHIARMLHSVRLGFYTTLMHGFENKKERLFNSRLRWILNCPPAGGFWDINRKNTLYCRNLFCPWCWMRRHDLIYRAVHSPASEMVTCLGRKARGLGFANSYRGLYCLSFRAAGIGFFDSPAHFNELRRVSDLEVAGFRKNRVMLRVCYPMPDLNGMTIAYMSDRPFENIVSGVDDFTSLRGGKLGVYATPKPLLFSRLLASRMLWAPEMLAHPDVAEKTVEIFRGKNLFSVSRGETDGSGTGVCSRSAPASHDLEQLAGSAQ